MLNRRRFDRSHRRDRAIAVVVAVVAGGVLAACFSVLGAARHPLSGAATADCPSIPCDVRRAGNS
jgi:hypothetical protein